MERYEEVGMLVGRELKMVDGHRRVVVQIDGRECCCVNPSEAIGVIYALKDLLNKEGIDPDEVAYMEYPDFQPSETVH